MAAIKAQALGFGAEKGGQGGGGHAAYFTRPLAREELGAISARAIPVCSGAEPNVQHMYPYRGLSLTCHGSDIGIAVEDTVAWKSLGVPINI
jgi:hypothetical protein